MLALDLDADRIPAAMISLPSASDRAKASKKVLRSLDIAPVRMFAAVNGTQLSQGGRAYPQKKTGTVRLVYTDSEGKRVSALQHGGQMGAAGQVDIWRQHGCLLSHRSLLLTMQQRSVPAYIAFEDDLVLGRQFDVAADVISRLQQGIRSLTRRFPSWKLLLLGGTPVDRFALWGSKNGSSGVRGIRRAEAVYQAHAYVVRKDAYSDLSRFFLKGLPADNCMVSFMRQHAGECFFFDPPLLDQDNSIPSQLVKQCAAKGSGGNLGYKRARKGVHAQKKRGTVGLSGHYRDRNRQPVRKSALKQSRGSAGQSGGKQSAGNGSSVAEQRCAERYMISYHRKHGSWPKVRDALAHPRGPKSIYSWLRIKRSHAA